MRLIMKYYVGDEECSCTNVVPIIHSSKEEARLDLGSKILEVEEAQAKYRREYALWENQYNSLSSPEKKVEAFSSRPQSPKDTIEFGGKTFSASIFYEYQYDLIKQESTSVFIEPQFLTLDEFYGGKE